MRSTGRIAPAPNPPDDPSTDACASAPARPHLYEGVFAHEYQHLLESYEDPDEVNWINEGLSDWAQTLVGYVNPALPITDTGFDSHIQCFFGWLSVATPVNPNPRAACGPENSLTRWLDQGDPEILADYGAAYSMMEMLQSRYGNDFMTALHRGDAQRPRQGSRRRSMHYGRPAATTTSTATTMTATTARRSAPRTSSTTGA